MYWSLSVSRGTGGWRMSQQSSPRGAIVPLCICGVYRKLLGDRGFSQPDAGGWAEHVVSLQRNAGQCIGKSFCLLKRLHQLLYLACALYVLLLAVLSLFPSYDCKPEMGSWCQSRTWKTGSFFSIVTVSSRNNSHITVYFSLRIY